MTKRYFRPEEVDALIPELTRIMDAVMRAHAQAFPEIFGEGANVSAGRTDDAHLQIARAIVILV